MELKLNTDHEQVETELGIIDIWQIEKGEIFTIEIFPPNQSEESFENGEFTNVWNVLETACNMDFVKFTHVPKNWTWEQTCDMEQQAVTTIFSMLGTIQNLEDFKDTKLKDGTPVYESLRVIRNKYNDDYCAYCGCELDDSNRRQNENEITVCEDCFIQEQAKKLGVIDIFKNELYKTSPNENDSMSALHQFYGNLKELGNFPKTVIIKDKIVHRKDLQLELFNENKTGFYLYGNAEDGTPVKVSYINDNFFNFPFMKQLIEILEKDIKKGNEVNKILGTFIRKQVL